MDFQFVKGLTKYDKLAMSFHFSFQSGSNSVLKRMNRKSKREEYFKLMDEFYKFFPDANYGSDFIVGFPGETEKEFSKTVEFIDNSILTYLHIFRFWPRIGTKAAEMNDAVPVQISRRRAGELKEINKNLKFKYREKNIDKIISGIIIEESEDFSLVVTSNFLTVKVPPSKGKKKKKVNVKIKSFINENICEGVLVKKKKNRIEKK
jgi:threonylcarbamoyladenosine tRNA methylthiotransferase MtaB